MGGKVCLSTVRLFPCRAAGHTGRKMKGTTISPASTQPLTAVPRLWVSRREMQPCAASYPSCTTFPTTALLLMSPLCPSSTSREHSQLPAGFNPCLSTQPCPDCPRVICWGTDPHTWAHTSPGIRVQAAPALLHQPLQILHLELFYPTYTCSLNPLLVPATAFPIVMQLEENKLSRPFLLFHLKLVCHLFHFSVKMWH